MSNVMTERWLNWIKELPNSRVYFDRQSQKWCCRWIKTREPYEEVTECDDDPYWAVMRAWKAYDREHQD